MQKAEIKLIDRKFAETRQNKMAAAVGGFRESKNLSIHAKLDRFNENKNINQNTSNWTFVQHRRSFTKLLKATNLGFSYATSRKEGE